MATNKLKKRKSAPKPATRMERFGASIFDTAFLIPCFYYSSTRESGAPFPAVSDLALILIVAFTLLFLMVQTALLTLRGQTIGKLIVQIKIVRMKDGQNGGFFTNFLVRGFLVFLLGLIPIAGSIFALVDPLFIFRDDRRCIHDFIAGTRVVKVQ